MLFNAKSIFIQVKKVKLATVAEGNQKALLSVGVGEGASPFPGFLHFTLHMYLILLSVKQGGIKYYFSSLWYDATWDWTHVSRTIGERSTHWANVTNGPEDLGSIPGRVIPKTQKYSTRCYLV